MKKYDLPALMRLLAVPALTVILGLVLMLDPDSAAALAGRILGGILILVGAGFGLRAFRETDAMRIRHAVLAAVCVLGGFWFVIHPLTLAQSVGRVVGLLLVLRGAGNLAASYRAEGVLRFSRTMVVCMLTVLGGLVLLVMPLTTSRLLFSVCGIVLICIGIADGYDRLRGRKYLEESDDPNIIDAL